MYLGRIVEVAPDKALYAGPLPDHEKICSEVEPELRERCEGHFAACHLEQDLA